MYHGTISTLQTLMLQRLADVGLTTPVSNFEPVDSWIATLVPEAPSLTGAPTHFVNLVESAYHRCAGLNAENRERWLHLEVDADYSVRCYISCRNYQQEFPFATIRQSLGSSSYSKL
ncbi:hypothetical protein PoB_005952900 [Plakobranchus ocellatus]|uniref:Uncharacterized protein n=1 Tax=Plakobranchus ocellatus TaxID=259542 RepID=A0AAV4CN48_9GAST|nr:hypothetical protein PoB_005952900 [Plakobranchus ocellatus]